jgi:hypothetical protein
VAALTFLVSSGVADATAAPINSAANASVDFDAIT